MNRPCFVGWASFAGSCTLAAAQAVCCEQLDALQPVHFLDQMAALVDHSLVQQSTAANGETRFTMLDSLRTFAAEQLEASGEMALVNHRHMDYYLRWAEQILPWLEYPDQRPDCRHTCHQPRHSERSPH